MSITFPLVCLVRFSPLSPVPRRLKLSQSIFGSSLKAFRQHSISIKRSRHFRFFPRLCSDKRTREKNCGKKSLSVFFCCMLSTAKPARDRRLWNGKRKPQGNEAKSRQQEDISWADFLLLLLDKPISVWRGEKCENEANHSDGVRGEKSIFSALI